MAGEKLSYGQFEDFAPGGRKHFVPDHRLGEGLIPNENEKMVPHELHRTRMLHDAAEQTQPDSDSFLTTRVQEQQAAASPMMSSYQAMQAGVSLEPKKRTGKRTYNPNQLPGVSPIGNAASLGAMGGVRNDPPTVLALGTTKMSAHVPGYAGHIPRTAAQTDSAPTRTMDKSLIVENYKPYGMGYTGKRA